MTTAPITLSMVSEITQVSCAVCVCVCRGEGNAMVREAVPPESDLLCKNGGAHEGHYDHAERAEGGHEDGPSLLHYHGL